MSKTPPAVNIPKKADGGFNPIEYGKKIYNIWERDPMLGIVTTPFSIAFAIWFFTREELVGRVLLYLSIAVGLVSIASAVKHMVINNIQAKYGLEARRQEVIEIEAGTQNDKNLAETHFQMEMALLLAHQSGFSADALLMRAVEYMEGGGDDPKVLKIFAGAVRDIRNGLNEEKDKISLPFKEYIAELFITPEEKEVDPSAVPSPPADKFAYNEEGLTPDMIKKQADRIESSNPTAEELENASKELGYDV